VIAEGPGTLDYLLRAAYDAGRRDLSYEEWRSGLMARPDTAADATHTRPQPSPR
jgi:hypothetical protein